MHWAIIAIPTVIVAGVLFYSFTKVRRGNWIHIDASVPTERKQLNIAMTLVLLVSSLVSYLLELPLVLSLGLFVVAMMVGTMLLLDRWLKVSLHMSFALFASSLFLPNFRFVLGGVLLSLAIGWSRIVLGRHTRVEVAAGSLIGATAGIIQFIWGIN